MTESTNTPAGLQTFTVGDGRVTMSAACDYATDEGRAAYKAAKEAAQTMANETKAAVSLYAAKGYKLGWAQPKVVAPTMTASSLKMHDRFTYAGGDYKVTAVDGDGGVIADHTSDPSIGFAVIGPDEAVTI